MGSKYDDRWETMKQLPEGGQAHTYLVRDLNSADIDARFVLKRLKNTKRLTRFQREVEATLKLDHKNIIRPIAYNLTAKNPYLVTEYCEGGTLADLMKMRPPDIVEALRLFITIADAVNYAHTESIIHRDIKPENIFIRLPDGGPVIGDFGLCLIVDDDDDRHTLSNEAVGPRLFMAPELEDGRIDSVTSSADVYSLGKILFWLVSGGRIFSREKLREPKWNLGTSLQHDFEQGFNPGGEHVTRLIEKMIVAEPQNRATLNEIILSAKRIQQLIYQGVNPVGGNFPQTCTYCRWGKYAEVASGSSASVYNFGVHIIGAPNWRILVCSECGHVQMFRLDMSKATQWTKSSNTAN